ncbi:MAG: ATP-binding protein [Sphaerochaetaceae bacterium]|nr:ATP-binding protein [Sphaerochaetaceae bacterium]MDD4397685.1 ATP-binding protein [Sphaerochaetaceae bacterium]
MYYKRTIEKSIIEASRTFPCIAVYGPRQVGKSTTIQMLFPELPHVSLDDAQDRNLANINPSLFLDNLGWPVLIDEVNKAPKLFDEIKIRIDKQRFAWMKGNKPCKLMYVISGSNQFELKQSVSDSLAGRTAVLTMSSFTYAEKSKTGGSAFDPDIQAIIQKQKNLGVEARTRRQMFEEIFKGGMPDIIASKADRTLFFKSYVETYMEKDIRRLINVSSEASFMSFLSIVALRTAQTINYDDISNSLGINMETCKRWLSILESSGIISILQPFHSNLSNRITKTPKLYFMDTGLCAYLCKWPSSEILEDCAMSGAFFETYVVSEMIKSLQNAGLDPKQYLYFYRDRDQKEIDVIFEKNGCIYPIEIKKGINPSKPTKNFKVLEKTRIPIETGLVIDCCDQIRPINENVYCCPAVLVSI